MTESRRCCIYLPNEKKLELTLLVRFCEIEFNFM